jgi:glutamine amidotransferase
MGWNDLTLLQPKHPVLRHLETGMHGYFVHGYHLSCRRAEDRLIDVDYGGPITAAVGRGNLIGTQFHPEKSQETGLRLITDFLDWRP